MTSSDFLPVILKSVFSPKILILTLMLGNFGTFSPSNAGGLVGDILRGTGIRPLQDLGDNLDDEHRRFKDKNRLYKEAEEGTSNFVRKQFTAACAAPFNGITNALIAKCSNYPGRRRNKQAINSAIDNLVQLGIFSRHEFNGIQIRWCPLNGAEGTAPDRGRIYLDTRTSRDPVQLAALLAHEMYHIRQYRNMGTDRFKCEYSRQYIACGGCQNRRHRLERHAYEFEDRVFHQLANAGRSRNQYSSARQPLANKCGTYAGWCSLNNSGPLGAPCSCRSRYGFVHGNIIR